MEATIVVHAAYEDHRLASFYYSYIPKIDRGWVVHSLRPHIVPDSGPRPKFSHRLLPEMSDKATALLKRQHKVLWLIPLYGLRPSDEPYEHYHVHLWEDLERGMVAPEVVAYAIMFEDSFQQHFPRADPTDPDVLSEAKQYLRRWLWHINKRANYNYYVYIRCRLDEQGTITGIHSMGKLSADLHELPDVQRTQLVSLLPIEIAAVSEDGRLLTLQTKVIDDEQRNK